MDTVFTPRKPEMYSSVFMTPPFSSEKNNETDQVRNLQISVPVPEFLRLTPPKVEHTKLDILSLLSDRGCPHIANSILSYLRPCDLNNFLSVSTSWRRMAVRQPFSDIIRNFKKEMLKEKENTYIKETEQFNALTRNPLNLLPNNSLPISSVNTKGLVPTVTPSHKCRPCPQCSSPAKVISRSRSQCDVCQYDFCPKCFKSFGVDNKCNCVSNISPKKRQETIAGNSRSKKRLRRL